MSHVTVGVKMLKCQIPLPDTGWNKIDESSVQPFGTATGGGGGVVIQYGCFPVDLWDQGGLR